MKVYVIQGVNPEPWATGTVNCYGKGKGSLSSNEKVVVYQNAVREELQRQACWDSLDVWPKNVCFYYVRSTERGQPADTTNLNKATEDACQGIIFGNDRSNRRVVGEILDQGPDVENVGIIITVEDHHIDPEVREMFLDMLVPVPVRAFEGTDFVAPEEDWL